MYDVFRRTENAVCCTRKTTLLFKNVAETSIVAADSNEENTREQSWRYSSSADIQ